MINYKLHQGRIFRITINGSLSLEKTIAYIEQFGQIKNLPENLLILFDLRKAQLSMSAEDIGRVSAMCIRATRKFTTVKTAFIVEECYITMYTYLFGEKVKRTSHIRKVFSSTEIASRWLLGEDNKPGFFGTREISDKQVMYR